MNHDNKQRWLEKITRALTELKAGQHVDNARERGASAQPGEHASSSAKTK